MMSEQMNLTQENATELKQVLEKMQKTNSNLVYRFFEITDCCGGQVYFNNATGDYCCSICRNPTATIAAKKK